MDFEVWAPIPQNVELWLDGEVHEMSREELGWWRASVDAAPGQRYGFVLDDDGPLPDPRSRFQPEGIDRPSQILGPLSLPYVFEPKPLREWVVYELHIGTFTPEGTYRAAIERLDHLVDLGVDAVDVMPVNTFSGSHGWGYDGVNLFAPHHAYGAPEDLRALIEAAHERGLAMILDVVYNHLGPAGNHLARFGPYFTDLYNTPWGDAVNFDDAGSDEVRALFIDNALMWLEDYGFDALRLDAVHAIFDRSATHFLEELSMRVDARAAELGKTWHLIAESDLNDPRLVSPRDRGGFGLSAQWSDDFHHALHAVVTGERNGYYADFGDLAHLAKALHSAYVYDGTRSGYRGRRHGRRVTGLEGDSFFGYIQNHDQVGNRARGERINATAGVDAQKICAALVLTSPFVPMLFMGEEWGASTPFPYFTSHPDRALGRAVSEGRTNEFASFGWAREDIPDPQDPQTFASAKLDWSETGTPEHSEMLGFYRELIALRKTHPELRDPAFTNVDVTYDENERWIAVTRGPFRIVCNLADVELETTEGGDLILASKKQRSPGVLEPRSVSILRR